MSAFVSARRSAQWLVVVSSRRPRNATVGRTIQTRNTIIGRTCSTTTSATLHGKYTATFSPLFPLTSARIRLFSTTSSSLLLPLDVDVSGSVSVDEPDLDSSLLNNSVEEEDTKRYFADLENLHHKTLNTLTQKGITSMTEIQARTWDAVIEGKDVVGRSRTGSGKAGNNIV